MRYDRRVKYEGVEDGEEREAGGKGEQEETGRGAYHSARSNTMRTIVPTFAIHSNSWRGDMQPSRATLRTVVAHAYDYIYSELSTRGSELEREKEKNLFSSTNSFLKRTII